MSQESQAYIHQSALGLIGNAIAVGRNQTTQRIMGMYGNREVLQKSVDAEEADSKTDKEREEEAKGKGKTHGVGNDATGTLDTNVDEDDGIDKSKEENDKKEKEKIKKPYTGERKPDAIEKSYDSRIGSMAYNRDAYLGLGKQPKKEEVIEKSNSAIDALRYSAKVKKTGKEIKEKLSGVKTKISAERDKAKSSYEDLKKKITEEPKADYSSYKTKELQQHMPEIPKSYEWGQMYPNTNGNGSPYALVDTVYSADSKAKTEEIAQGQYMQEYNRFVYAYCDACCDLCYLDTLNNNLKDDQEVELSVQDLATLGF